MSSSEILNSPTVFAHSRTSFTSILSNKDFADAVSVPRETSISEFSSFWGAKFLLDLNALNALNCCTVFDYILGNMVVLSGLEN